MKSAGTVLLVDSSAVGRGRLRDQLAHLCEVRVAQNLTIAQARVEEHLPEAAIVSVATGADDELRLLAWLSRQAVPTLVLLASESLRRQVTALGSAEIMLAARGRDENALKQQSLAIERWVRVVLTELEDSALLRPPPAPPRPASSGALRAVRAEPRWASEDNASRAIICIGISTGGPEALEVLFRRLPKRAPAIVIVQHMPRSFTAALAQRLNEASEMDVSEAQGQDVLRSGSALIAPGDQHLRLRRQGLHVVTELDDGPLVDRHRPSVNVLFESAAQVLGPNAIGVVMTGMGDDGARGLLAMQRAGATTVAQDAQGCTVFGMPQRAIALGAANHVVTLSDLADRLLEYAALPDALGAVP
jgi:two-component system chemotaxis response regulator CheB